MLPNLPDTALDYIWNRLQDVDKFSMRLASKEWLGLTNARLFISFNIMNINSLKLNLLPKYGHLVNKLNISEVEFNANKLLNQCNNMKSLSLKRVKLVYEDIQDNDKLRNLSIALDGRNVSDRDILTWIPLVESFSNLTTLVLLDFDPITAQDLFYCLPNLIKFKYISNGIIIPKTWKGNYLKKLTTNYDLQFKQNYRNPNLKELYIKSYHKFSIDSDFLSISSSCFPNLVNLTLILWNGYLLETDAYEFKNLKLLHINYKQFTFDMLNKLINNNTKLYHLHIHKLNNTIQLPLDEMIAKLKNLSHLYIDLSNCELDVVALEELPVLNQITHLGIHFSHLTMRKLYLLSEKFPKVKVFEFIGVVISLKELSFESAKMFTSTSNHGLSFNWNTLIVPEFNKLTINVIKFAPKLNMLYHRFKISDIPPDDAMELLKYSHKDLMIEYWTPKEDF